MWLMWPRRSTRTPTPGFEIYNFGSREKRKRFFKKYTNFTFFTLKLPPLGVGSNEIYNLLSPYPTDATYQFLVRIGKVLFELKMLKDGGRQWTPIHRNRSPEWLRWPNEKKKQKLLQWLWSWSSDIWSFYRTIDDYFTRSYNENRISQ